MGPSTYARIISRHVFTSTPLPLLHSPYRAWARHRRHPCGRARGGRARRRRRPFGACAPVPARSGPPVPRASPSGRGGRRPRLPSHAACTAVAIPCSLGGTPLRGVRRTSAGRRRPRPVFITPPPLTAAVTPRNRRSSRLRIRTRPRPPRGCVSATGAACPRAPRPHRRAWARR